MGFLDRFKGKKKPEEEFKIENTDTPEYKKILESLQEVWSWKFHEILNLKEVYTVADKARESASTPEEIQLHDQFIEIVAKKFHLFISIPYWAPIPLESLKKGKGGYIFFKKEVIEEAEKFKVEIEEFIGFIQQNFYETIPEYSEIMINTLIYYMSFLDKVIYVTDQRLNTAEIISDICNKTFQEVESFLNIFKILPPMDFKPPFLISTEISEEEFTTGAYWDDVSEGVIVCPALFHDENFNLLRSDLAHEIAHAQLHSGQWKKYMWKYQAHLEGLGRKLNRAKKDWNVLKTKLTTEESDHLSRQVSSFEYDFDRLYNVRFEVSEGFAVLIGCLYASKISFETFLKVWKGLPNKYKYHYQEFVRKVLKIEDVWNIEGIFENMFYLTKFFKDSDKRMENLITEIEQRKQKTQIEIKSVQTS